MSPGRLPEQLPDSSSLLALCAPYSFLDGCNYEDHEHEDDLKSWIASLVVGKKITKYTPKWWFNSNLVGGFNPFEKY